MVIIVYDGEDERNDQPNPTKSLGEVRFVNDVEMVGENVPTNVGGQCKGG